VELQADGPAGHIAALSLRLYNPQSRQWSHNFANSKSEMHSYKTKPGRGADFLEAFQARSIPAHRDRHGDIGSVSLRQGSRHFFLCGFPCVASREPMKAQFYEGELWKSELENILMAMLEKYAVVVVGRLRPSRLLVA